MNIRLLLFPLLAALPAALPAAPACCAETATGARASCCADDTKTPAAADSAESAPLPADSLYQLDASFTDDTGAPFSLASLRGHPVVLTMFFSNCGYACPVLVATMGQIREALPADIRADTRFVLVSFDVAHDTPAVLHEYRTQRDLGRDWILLHGDDSSVRELAALVGVKYKREAGGMFSHSNLITILNPDGQIAFQRTGLKGPIDASVHAVQTAATLTP